MKLSWLRNTAAGLCSCALVLGCAVEKTQSRIPPSPSPAEELIEDSFSLRGGLQETDKEQRLIAIRRHALEKEFLLQGSLITQAAVPMSSGLRSRIVVFKLYGDFLYLLEASQGHLVTKDLPQNLVLTKFPITQQDTQLIYFDFNAGMSRIFVEGDWYASDLYGGTYSDRTWDNLSVESSYIEQTRVDGNNLIIRQIAQMLTPSESSTQTTPVEVKYYLTPYKENAGFVPTHTADFDRMGFFEVAPAIPNTGEAPIIYASKFDTRKPIVFSISANTPQEYREAIREGILYWNKAFGYAALRVIDAPAGVTAPDFKHNLVQWVDWPDAGFAYADAQMDPRTGEILHAQVFMTSVFAISGKARARSLLKRLATHTATSATSATTTPKAISLAGFQNKPLCQFNPTETLRDSLTHLLAHEATLTDKDFLRISQDYITEVIAHEIGHTLGFRHNFAGSLGMNFDQNEKHSLFKTYIEKATVADHIAPTTSVMEYQRFEESAMAGHHITHAKTTFSYDYQAVQALYMNAHVPHEEIPFFCTDSHKGQYWDCNTFDSGLSAIEYHLYRHDEQISNLPYSLIEGFIAAKTDPLYRNHKDLLKGVPSVSETIDGMLTHKNQLLKLFGNSLKLLSVRRTFSTIHELNEQDVIEQEQDALVKQVEKHAQTLARSFTLQPVVDLLQGYQNFETLLDKEDYRTGTDAYGRTYKLDESEITHMKQLGKIFFQQTAFAYQMADLQSLSKVDSIKNPHLTRIASQLLAFKAKFFVTNASAEDNLTIPLVQGDGSTKALNLPSFSYPVDVRLMAAKLLDKPVPTEPLWGRADKKALHKEFKELLDKTLETDIATLDLENQSAELVVWVLENRKILSALSVAKL